MEYPHPHYRHQQPTKTMRCAILLYRQNFLKHHIYPLPFNRYLDLLRRENRVNGNLYQVPVQNLQGNLGCTVEEEISVVGEVGPSEELAPSLHEDREVIGPLRLWSVRLHLPSIQVLALSLPLL